MPLFDGLAGVVHCDAVHLSTGRYGPVHPIAVRVAKPSGSARVGKPERRSVMSRTGRDQRRRGRVNLRRSSGERVVCLPARDSRDR